eukprot:TRINITY_DN78521_c0_g1_i1.p1 TRINITY_DN78521_c0_g1~~TRINITY_DN78521_c0_g1_i1.p1  ORF type:complete len:189 (-),score=14.63 TRINITY_DN78521_c0_g1_i1:46-612(-)
MPKRKAASAEPTKKKQKVEKTKNATKKTPSLTKSPTTFQDQILAILAEADKPLGLPSIKKQLIAQFDRKDSAAFRKHVTAALKALTVAGRSDFQVVGGSYCGGPESKAGRNLKAAKDKKVSDKVERQERIDAGQVQCPWCTVWNESVGTFRYHKSRHDVYKCPDCSKTFFGCLDVWPGEWHQDTELYY